MLNCSHEVKRRLLLEKKAMTNLDSILKSKRHHFAYKGPYNQCYGFSSSHVRVWELDHKEDSVPKNWYFWIVGTEKTLESPLDCKKIKPVNPKGNKPWIIIERTDAEAEALILWSPNAKSQLIGKRPRGWERLLAREGDDRWYFWMVSLIQWAWVWASSRRW